MIAIINMYRYSIESAISGISTLFPFLNYIKKRDYQ